MLFLVGQAHPSESCQDLTLTLWIPGQALIAASSKLASFKIRPYLGSWFMAHSLMHISRDDHTINCVGTLSKQY